MKTMHDFRFDLQCDHPAWRHCRVVMTARGFDEQGKAVHFFSLDSFALSPREQTPAQLSLPCAGCRSVELYLYIIPHLLPAGNDVGDYPALPAKLQISDGSTLLSHEELPVNPWGGLSRHYHLPKKQ